MMRSLLLVVCVSAPVLALPRFTEEREAAALLFVKKHLPDLSPLLGELKKTNPTRYHQEISEIFQVSEMLADLLDEPRRYDLDDGNGEAERAWTGNNEDGDSDGDREMPVAGRGKPAKQGDDGDCMNDG